MVSTPGTDPLLDAALNLAACHEQHERFYASSPLESAVRLQRHARALLALADRWATVAPSDHRGVSPFEGAEDLNSEAATALDGVLFMEGEGRPAEITAMIGELRTDAGSLAGAGEWLASAMRASWQMAAGPCWPAPPTCSSTSTSPRPPCGPTWPGRGSRRGG
jgi:hypothetical protein